MDVDNGNKRLYNRLGGAPSVDKSQQVCYHWRAGRCNRHPCLYRHSELPQAAGNGMALKRSQMIPSDDGNFSGSQSFSRRKPNSTNPRGDIQLSSKWGRGQGGAVGGGPGGGGFRAPQKRLDKICNYWLVGKCSYGDNCKFQHQWFVSECFTMLTQLAGHEKVISGIAFPMGSDKLYSGSKDNSVRVWDCQTGQCSAVINLGAEIGCMISEGPWVFVGIPNFVKAWNTQTNTELSLDGFSGQVYSLTVGNEMLLAGTQDGSILVWRFTAATNGFEPAASLKGHTSAVVSLVVGANRLYSGSMDNTIRVWELETLQCIQTLTEHTSVVMSVLCWDLFLLSCSLDHTIKVWVATESGKLEVTYTHQEEQGVLSLCGMHDAQGKPVLICSCNDNTVRVYDLPSFNERGKIFAKEEIRAIQIGPGGLFFTGDGTGELKVWKWSEQ
ncbi:zinc finger protein [Macleaya cordata]|uniref:Zinc finger protein n=1 Tax=Macleaya cordata TaxID=56857 RepID=A0A200PW88_MACCD|nr:zinc finger protein [Macleaya cordata]